MAKLLKLLHHCIFLCFEFRTKMREKTVVLVLGEETVCWWNHSMGSYIDYLVRVVCIF